ncbi:hypothetical protein RIF29_29880 [Crotalaria pallida]|uniref:Uncharacterized protein n=1 Tax=Crotalaria pallida TaxID=3830 RepID=A0AAN9HWL4_CROPI
MADPTPFTKTHHSPFSRTHQQKPIINNNKGKSFSAFLFKYLFLALFIIAVPLFPSQAPDFVNQTLLTKFWELIHLLFIGIVVAYGLFSRRNVEHEIIDIDIGTESRASSVVVGGGNAASYVSKMFPVSTIFDENENFDEKRMMMMHCWNNQYFDGGQEGFVCPPPNGGVAAVGVFDEQYKTQMPISEDGFGYSVGFDGTNEVQAWNSESYQSEPVVVIAQPCYAVGECGEVVGYKPLGLPVRSLRSVTGGGGRGGGVDGVKYSNESDSSSGSRGSRNSSLKNKDREFGDMDPSSLEKEFNDASAVGASASPIPWRSRPRKMGRQKGYGHVTRPVHCRPLSVDETKFEALSSSSSQSTIPFSSDAAMYCTMNSISSDNMNFQEEEIGKEEASYVPAPEKMNFQEEDLRQKTSFVPASENMNFEEEDLGQRKTSYMPGSENMNFQEVDLGKKIFQGSSSRNGRKGTKGKYATVSHPSHFRPMSVDESQLESLTSRSFQSMGSFSSHPSMYSSFDSNTSDNMNFQDEDIEQEKTSRVYVSENMISREEDMGLKKAFNVHGSENVNFQEEKLRQRKTCYVPASENIKFQEEDMGPKKTFYVHASENVNFQEENLGQKKTSFVPASENMNFPEFDLGKKISRGTYSRNGRMETKGKSAYAPVPSHFRPMSVDESQFEEGNVSFQEEDIGKKIPDGISSRNGRTETKGKSAAVSHPSHFRPMSVDETQFEEENLGQKKTYYEHGSENMNFQEEDLGKNISQGLSSRDGRTETKGKSAAVDETQFELLSGRSFRSMGSFSSRKSLSSSVSSENMNLLNEDFEEKKSSHGSSSSSSSPPARSNHVRIYSNDSLLQDDIQSNLSDDLRDLSEIRGEDPPGNKESGMHAMLSDSEKPASLPKTPSRGKSVRTRRASGLSSGQIRIGEISSKQTDEKVEKKPNNVEAALMRKDKMKSGEPDIPLKGTSKKTLDSYCPPKPEVAFTDHHKRDKQELSKNVSSIDDSDSEVENIQLSSDDDEVSERVNDSGLDSEVDKKASEFIAKFKAQIRLQKMGSLDRSKGQKTIGNYIR